MKQDVVPFLMSRMRRISSTWFQLKTADQIMFIALFFHRVTIMWVVLGGRRKRLLPGKQTNLDTKSGNESDQQIAGFEYEGEPTYCPHLIPFTVWTGLATSKFETKQVAS